MPLALRGSIACVSTSDFAANELARIRTHVGDLSCAPRGVGGCGTRLDTSQPESRNGAVQAPVRMDAWRSGVGSNEVAILVLAILYTSSLLASSGAG